MFGKSSLSSSQEKKNPKAGIRRALAALALAGSLGTIALATPLAASAGTVTLGPGGISENTDLVVWPQDGSLIGSGPLAGCQVLVGDHWLSQGWASGEGEVRCNLPHNYSMQVLLEYYTPSGMRLASSASSSWRGGAGTWWYLSTGGVCQPGGPATTYYWTTYVEVSVDGSAYQGWFTSRQNAGYTIPAC